MAPDAKKAHLEEAMPEFLITEIADIKEKFQQIIVKK
eukprot:CAMPEP_0202964224 /NCGR_PEP_ID=MMETSP1396-20130829/8297_1 /ASSEMBLY_ACC=CAM_ASM_000872 /TAXON_ID= /ORGANISM="Pseudokeronopsis sp., Strain Brazil" /LENGTH=36 /DNA_ID= /DNA_START= /DNA_END= /DNA_ORIENTATION=